MKRILKGYLLTALAFVCVIAVVCGVFTAGANTKKISLGRAEAVFAVSNSGQGIVLNYGDTPPVSINGANMIWVRLAISIMPPPVSNIYWLFSGISVLAANGFSL